MDTDTVQDVTPLVIATMPDTTQGKLDMLAELRDRRSLATIEIDQRIAGLNMERTALTADLDEQVAALEMAIKFDVMRAGQTIKGVRLMAVWSKGRVSWDNRRLDGYAMAHPELLAFRTEGEPSVSIRVNGKA